jgi:hypothetical protein
MEENTPHETGRSIRKAGIIRGVIGSIGLAAQDSDPAPETTIVEADNDTLGNGDVDQDEEVPEEYAAAEACWVALEEQFNLHDLDDEGIDGQAAEDSVDWEAFDAQAEACEALLPQDVQDEIAAHEEAFGPYEACVDAVLEEQGFDDGDFLGDAEMFDFGPAVSIMTGDTASFAEFGEGDGHVTITKTGDDFTVTSDGDVSIEDIDWDAAFAGCDDQLPEGFDDGDFELFGEADHQDESDDELANS